MTTLLNRALAMLRVWLGRSPGAPDEPMTPAHGWLLPDTGVLMSLRGAAPVAVTPVRTKG